MGFTKLDDGLIFSSILSEDDSVFKVWVLILSRTDGDGVARISSSFLASVTRKADEEIERCLRVLESADPRSRSVNDDGRRIARVDGGYQVLNYLKYRERVEVAAKREYERERKRAYRSDGTSGTPTPGYVYFLRAGNAVKIGFSANPWSRAKEIQTGNPERGELIGTIRGTQEDETELHERFAAVRLEGEWFSATTELLNYVVAARGTTPGPSASASPSASVSVEKEREETPSRNETFPPSHPTDRAEAETAGEIRRLQNELGARLARLAEHKNSRLMVPAWSRRVTSYKRKDGTKVNGVPDYRTVMSIDRLERSIEDADWWLAKLDTGLVMEALSGPR